MKWLDPQAFRWDESPPLSSFRAVATTSAGYVALVVASTFLSKKLLPATTTSRGWKPWFGSDLQTLQLVHNLILVVSSAAMFCGVVVESLRRLSLTLPDNDNDELQLPLQSSWPPFLFCEQQPTGAGALYYWSYLYYLSKYYELLDTLLQLARGKPPPHFALHVYHHAVVLFMAWGWCEYQQSLHHIGLAFNTAVHVVMYTYFLQRTLLQTPPKWKSFVTLFQIVQFVVSFVCFLITLYIVCVQKHQCSGMRALALNSVFNLTLLHSFWEVFRMGRQKDKKV